MDEDADLLEATALKFRCLCKLELELIAVNGVLRSGGRTRAILALAATLIRLDTQEVEGLNSMIKTSVARAQNGRISLELLSSRVCMRKVISMSTGGSTRAKIIRPFAAALARSAFLFNGSHYKLLTDEHRYKAPKSSSTAMTLPQADPLRFDPIRSTSVESSTWAFKYHSKFIKMHKQHWKAKNHPPNQLLALLVPTSATPSTFACYVGCALAHSQAVMTKLNLLGSGSGNYVLSDLCHEDVLLFEKSLDIIASLHHLVEARKKEQKTNLKLYTQLMEMQQADGQSNQSCIFASKGRKKMLCELRAKYVRNPRTSASTTARVLDTAESEMPALASDEQMPTQPLDSLELDDEDCVSEDGGCEEGHVQAEQREQRDQNIMRLLFDVDGSDTDSDTSSLPEGEQAELDELVSLNESMAATCANQCAGKGDKTVITVANKVQDRRDSSNFVDSIGSLSDIEQQQEALLQEVLSGSSLLDVDNDVDAKGAETQAGKDDAIEVNESMMSHFAQNVAPTMEEAFLNQWACAIKQAIEALVFRHQNRNQNVGSDLSLVFEARDGTAAVVLIQWSHKDIRHGREIRLDEENRIICPVHFMQKSRTIDWDSAELILPSVGEAARRVKKNDRPHLPKHALFLFNLYKTAISCHAQEAELLVALEDASGSISDCSNCLICCSNSPGRKQACAMCGLITHTECAAVLHSKQGPPALNFDHEHHHEGFGIEMIPNILLCSVQTDDTSPWRSQLGWQPVQWLTVWCAIARPYNKKSFFKLSYAQCFRLQMYGDIIRGLATVMVTPLHHCKIVISYSITCCLSVCVVCVICAHWK